jgi:hypothetical protein
MFTYEYVIIYTEPVGSFFVTPIYYLQYIQSFDIKSKNAQWYFNGIFPALEQWARQYNKRLTAYITWVNIL